METSLVLGGVVKVLGKEASRRDKTDTTKIWPPRITLGWIGGQVDPEITEDQYKALPEGGFVQVRIEFIIHPRFGYRLGKLVACEPLKERA
jgi:hypothetical protein